MFKGQTSTKLSDILIGCKRKKFLKLEILYLTANQDTSTSKSGRIRFLIQYIRRFVIIRKGPFFFSNRFVSLCVVREFSSDKMSFGLPSIIPKPTVPEQFEIKGGTNYDVPNPMISGLTATRQNVGYAHPLEASERNYVKNQDRMNMILLRNTQGLHAPLRIAMELKATEKIGRLPFLPSSNMMRDVLLGRDQDIGFEDIFNIPEFREQMGQPHAVVENHLGIL